MYSKKRWLLFFIVFALISSFLLSFYSSVYSSENAFLLGRMLDQPSRVGSIAPSSKRLASLMTQEALSAIKQSEGIVVEIGPGTGSVTRVLLEHGIAAQRLVCVEIDPALHQYMTDNFPEVRTILGDAAALDTLLSEQFGEIAAIVSGIPLKNLPLGKAVAMVQLCCSALKPSGKFVQFTYSVRPPAVPPGLHRQFVGFTFLNLPPAFVWSFTKM